MKVIEYRKLSEKGWHTSKDANMLSFCEKRIQEIVDTVPSFTLMTVDNDQRVHARAMSLKAHDGIEQIWFATHRSSHHAAQILKNPVVTLYFNDTDAYEGLMLTCNAFVEDSEERQKACWRDFYESVFTKGIQDPEFVVFRLEILSGNYGGKGINLTFSLKD